MTDVEARLRETLRGTLDQVAADPARGAAAVRRARRARAVRGVAAGLACAVFAATAALALTRGPDEDRPRPASEPEQAATFALDFGDSGDGTLTIDVPKAQACIAVSRNLADSVRELRRDDGTAEVVVEYLPSSWRPTCEPLDPSDAARILAEPGRHSVVLGAGGPSARSPLKPFEVAPPLLPLELEIVCSQDGAVVLTPQIQPRRDGVRLRIYNQDGAWRGFEVSSPEGRLGGGGLRRGVVFDKTWTIGPGALGIRCLRYPRADVYDPADPGFSQFTVVDPHGLWNDPELECVEGEQRRRVATATPARDTRELPDFDTLVREHVPGVEPGDVLERPRYPESAVKLEARTLIRDGRKIATLYLGTTGVSGRPDRVWSILPVACPGSGIGE